MYNPYIRKLAAKAISIITTIIILLIKPRGIAGILDKAREA